MRGEMYGNSVESASELFKYVCEKNGISSVMVKSDPSLSMDMMGESKGFLPIWMIKCEEYWSILSNKKMWSTTYKIDSDSVCGVRVENNGDDFSDIKNDELPVSLRFLLCSFAMKDIVAIENKMAYIKEDTRIYYNYNEESDTMELLDSGALQRLSFVSIMGVMKESLDKVQNKVPASDYDQYLQNSRDKIRAETDVSTSGPDM